MPSPASSRDRARWTASAGLIAAAALWAFGGCALVGYGFDGYGGAAGAAGTGGAGGASVSTSAGTGGQATAGTGGTGGGTSSTGTGMPCKVPSDCEDKNACTVEACTLGLCASTPLSIDDKDPCTDDACDPDKGVYHQPASCDDSDLCTTDACIEEKGCYHLPVTPADDINGCTNDLCNPGSGETVHLPIANCCPHSPCILGPPLDPASCPLPGPGKDCIKTVCTSFASCCSTAWDSTCVALAQSLCVPAGGVFTCGCTHSYCAEGEILYSFCDPCVASVCADPATAYCCDKNQNLGWNASCVAQVHNLCNIPLGAGCH
ncbi:MAG: hypothetical protein U0359_13335 [Byssovorax sp.]